METDTSETKLNAVKHSTVFYRIFSVVLTGVPPMISFHVRGNVAVTGNDDYITIDLNNMASPKEPAFRTIQGTIHLHFYIQVPNTSTHGIVKIRLYMVILSLIYEAYHIFNAY